MPKLLLLNILLTHVMLVTNVNPDLIKANLSYGVTFFYKQLKKVPHHPGVWPPGRYI